MQLRLAANEGDHALRLLVVGEDAVADVFGKLAELLVDGRRQALENFLIGDAFFVRPFGDGHIQAENLLDARL